jgi:hypothetical protein
MEIAPRNSLRGDKPRKAIGLKSPFRPNLFSSLPRIMPAFHWEANGFRIQVHFAQLFDKLDPSGLTCPH